MAPLDVTFTASASGGTGSYTYEWSGAVSGSSSSVSKTFKKAGTYTATVTVTSGQQTASATASVVVSPACAHPINFRQTVGTDAGNGVLCFKYEWDSSTGNLADLSDVIVGEKVTYPDGNPYRPPDPPYNNWEINNPTVRNTDGTFGWCGDTHGHKGFSKPYRRAGFSGTQIYRFHCNKCMASGEWQTLMGPHSIDRVVEQTTGGGWRYRINKTGVTATLNLP